MTSESAGKPDLRFGRVTFVEYWDLAAIMTEEHAEMQAWIEDDEFIDLSEDEIHEHLMNAVSEETVALAMENAVVRGKIIGHIEVLKLMREAEANDDEQASQE